MMVLFPTQKYNGSHGIGHKFSTKGFYGITIENAMQQNIRFHLTFQSKNCRNGMNIQGIGSYIFENIVGIFHYKSSIYVEYLINMLIASQTPWKHPFIIGGLCLYKGVTTPCYQPKLLHQVQQELTKIVLMCCFQLVFSSNIMNNQLVGVIWLDFLAPLSN